MHTYVRLIYTGRPSNLFCSEQSVALTMSLQELLSLDMSCVLRMTCSVGEEASSEFGILWLYFDLNPDMLINACMHVHVNLHMPTINSFLYWRVSCLDHITSRMVESRHVFCSAYDMFCWWRSLKWIDHPFAVLKFESGHVDQCIHACVHLICTSQPSILFCAKVFSCLDHVTWRMVESRHVFRWRTL